MRPRSHLHTTEHVGDLAQKYFGPLGERLDAMMARYSQSDCVSSRRSSSTCRNTVDRHLKEEGEPLDERNSSH